MKTPFLYIFPLLALVWCHLVQAQGSGGGSLSNAELIVEKNLALELPPAQRNFDKMSFLERRLPNTAQEFSFRMLDFPMAPLTPTINAAPFPRQGLAPQQGNYIKAGIGSFLTPYLDAFIGSTRNARYHYGANVHHLSSVFGPIDGANSGDSRTAVSGFGQMFANKGSLRAEAGYKRDKYYFYGYGNQPGEIDRDSIRQTYQTIEGAFQYQFSDARSPFALTSRLDMYRFWDRFDAGEYNLHLDIRPEYRINETGKVKAETQVIVNRFTDSVAYNRNLFKAGLSYLFSNGRLQVEGGVRFAYNADTINNVAAYNLYPNVNVSYELLEEVLTVYARFDGDLEQQTYRSFATENPFLNSNLLLAHTNRLASVRVGGVAHPISRIGIKLDGAYGFYRNYHFFTNSPLDSARFDLTYDGGTTYVFDAGAEVSANFDVIRGSLSARYYHYNPATVLEAWHRPTLVTNLMMAGKVGRKLGLEMNLFHMGGLQAAAPLTGERIKLNTILDLNLKAEYSIIENFTAFVAGQNLLGRYDRWYGYPVRGTMVMGGLTYRF